MHCQQAFAPPTSLSTPRIHVVSETDGFSASYEKPLTTTAATDRGEKFAEQPSDHSAVETPAAEPARVAKEAEERKAKEEAERIAKEEEERKAKEEAARVAKEEQERKAKQEAERIAKEEEDRKAKDEAERIAKEEEDRKAKQEAGRKHATMNRMLKRCANKLLHRWYHWKMFVRVPSDQGRANREDAKPPRRRSSRRSKGPSKAKASKSRTKTRSQVAYTSLSLLL